MTVDQFLLYVKLIIEFLTALTAPVVFASPLVAVITDHILKRLPFWKDGWAGWANLGLNMFFSGLLFVAAKTGYESEYTQAIVLSTSAIPIVLRILAGVGGARILHIFFVKHGIGKSLSNAG